MTITRAFDLAAEVQFIFDPDAVDPFYWINEDGNKQWRMEGIYSNVRTPEDIWTHLAYNAIFNGVTDAYRLDGWAELNKGDLTMRVRDQEIHA